MIKVIIFVTYRFSLINVSSSTMHFAKFRPRVKTTHIGSYAKMLNNSVLKEQADTDSQHTCEDEDTVMFYLFACLLVCIKFYKGHICKLFMLNFHYCELYKNLDSQSPQMDHLLLNIDIENGEVLFY